MAWERRLRQDVAFYACLTDEERARLHGLVQVFVDEKEWVAAKGVNLTDDRRALIAAQACLLILHLPHDYFECVPTILVLPEEYDSSTPESDDVAGVMIEGETRLGEVWHRGPVVISWQDALDGARGKAGGVNVVFHEFAHKLDLAEGLAGGRFPTRREEVERWARVLRTEYEKLVALSEQGRETILDEYGATDESEFFAVATETFFERGRELLQRHPDLYGMLRDFYRQDPAGWVPRPFPLIDDRPLDHTRRKP